MIHLQHAAFVYQAPDGEVEALRDVSFDVVEGEFCSIVGRRLRQVDAAVRARGA